MKPLLSPRNDTIFKLIFADSRDIEPLSDFLKSVLTIPAEDYEDITLIDPHLTRDGWGGKLGILDIKIKTRSGKLIDVEIQLIEQPGLRERIIFYLSRMIAEQIGEGENYLQIQRSICILIADFTLISENPYYHNQASDFVKIINNNTINVLYISILILPCMFALLLQTCSNGGSEVERQQGAGKWQAYGREGHTNGKSVYAEKVRLPSARPLKREQTRSVGRGRLNRKWIGGSMSHEVRRRTLPLLKP
jgi:hypothetical protein